MKKIWFFLLILISFVFLIGVNQYFFCPTFSFARPHPFSGSSFYNPYDSIEPNDWVKCNFHAHTNAWFGLTNGKGTARDVYHAYDSMGYGIHCVSDYQKINKEFANTAGYIPAYEHGYNLGKTHQLVLGSTSVRWIEYLFPQTLNNKQHVIQCLRRQGNVIFVNHPFAFHGYHPSDFRYLSGYNCIEALSPYALSTNCWDSALSSGKAVFVVGNDDEHNIFAKDCLARMCTWVNVSSANEDRVLNALKKGKSYGMILGDTMKVIPKLVYYRLIGDTIRLAVNIPAARISFVGQNGSVLSAGRNASSASYIMRPGDHYARTVIEFAGGTSIFLNPVFRSDSPAITTVVPPINSYQTVFWRILGFLIFGAWISAAFRAPFSRPIGPKSITWVLYFLLLSISLVYQILQSV